MIFFKPNFTHFALIFHYFVRCVKNIGKYGHGLERKEHDKVLLIGKKDYIMYVDIVCGG